MAAPGAAQRAGDVRFIKDVFFLAISPLVLRARSFLLIPLIISILGVSGYGIWTQFEVTLSLLLTLVSLNFGAAMNRMLAGEVSQVQIDDDVSSILAMQMAVAIPVTLVMIAAAAPIAGWLFGQPEFAPLSVALAVSLNASVVGNTVYGFLRARRHTQTIALINTVRWWGEFLVIVAVTLLTRSLVWLFVVYATYQVVANLAYPIYAIRQGWLRLRWPRFGRLRAYFAYSLPLFGTTIGFWICNSSDKYFVRWLLGIDALGLYAALYKFGSIILMLLEPIGEVLLPDTAALYDQQRVAEMRRRFALTLRYFTIIAVLAAVTVVAATPVLTTISGLGGAPAEFGLILLALCLGSTFYGASRLLHDLLAVRRHTALIGLIWLGLGALNTLANLLLIPALGIVGAALATAVTFLAGLLTLDWSVRRLYDGAWLWTGWLPQVALAAAPVMLLAWLLGSHLQGGYALAGVLLTSLILVGVLALARVIGVRELRFAASFVRR